jgi:hypothetical protein
MDLEELKRLLEKATPGPWKYVRAKRFTQGSVDNGIGSLYSQDCLIYTTPCDRSCLPETWKRQASDGELIAALRNAAPKLIEELEKQEA